MRELKETFEWPLAGLPAGVQPGDKVVKHINENQRLFFEIVKIDGDIVTLKPDPAVPA